MDLRKIDKKLLIRLFAAIVSIIVLVLIIIIIKLIMGNRISYNKIEDKMITAAQNYYKDNSDKLPVENNSSVSISIDELVKKDYIKELTKLTKDKDATCSGKVSVFKYNDQYLYEPELNCNDYYHTTYLKDILLKEENIVSSGDGLYKVNDNYIYRGEKVKNYAKFDDKDWLILRINSDGTIRMLELTKRDPVVWDDRYNIDKEYNSGINDYSLSRIKDSVDKIYKEEFSEKAKSYIVPQSLCIGSRGIKETVNDGSVECSKTLDNQPLGLVQANEFLLASIDPNCKYSYDSQCYNYNYFVRVGYQFWSITIDNSTTNKVYKMKTAPTLVDASNTSQVKTTVHINSSVRYVSGDGTKENPYTFK